MPAQQIWGYAAVLGLPFNLEWMYDELPLIYSGHYGQGYTIAIVDAFGDFNFTLASQYMYQSVACNDLATFDAIFSLPPPSSCQVIYPTGVPILTPYNLGTAVGWALESALDIEYAHTMAPGANILLVISPTAGDDLYVDIEYVVNNSLANFISLSWGIPEDMFYITPYAYDEIFMQAAAEGIGVFAASGDSGAFDTYWLAYNMPMEASVNYPASDPWITGVGGTELYVQFINGITQRMETAWNWRPSIVTCCCGMWGSGGGYSFAFNETPGQALIGMPYELQYVYEPDLGIWFSTVGHRGVPDIAADADPDTGVLIVLNGVIPPYLIGGTSLATPLSAGMTTTVQSAVPMFTIGDLAPNLYLIYHYMPSEAYVSITNVTGLETSSFFTGIPGAMFPTLGGDNGLYWAVPGMWNPVTGLGQINVYGLAQALNGLANK
jgi:subtilase family serine protease